MSELAQDTEVSAKAARRRFSSKEKSRILGEAAACEKQTGALGALLRREGIYSSHLARWRAALEKSGLKGLTPSKRGPVTKPVDPRDQQLVAAAQEIVRLKRRAERAEAIVELQKKVSEILGLSLLTESDEKR